MAFIVDKVGSVFGGAGEAIEEKVTVAKMEASAFADNRIDDIQQWKREKEQLLREFLAKKINAIYEYIMTVANEFAKEKIKDEYMPGFVQDLCDSSIDAIWPDIKIELRDMILNQITTEYPIRSHGDPPCCCGGHILSFIRYWTMPYDRGFWRQLRNPWYYFFHLVALIPYQAIGICWYIIWFLFIDKTDEYQLFRYIVDFKSLQFATLGILNTAIGAIMYYVCVTSNPPNCDEYAMREHPWTMGVFIVQVFIVWLAFLLMNCSEKKGGFYHQYNEATKMQQQEVAGTKDGRQSAFEALVGSDDSVSATLHYQSDAELLDASKGRLRIFLIYDFVIFVLCLGLAAWMAFANLLDDEAQVDVNDASSFSDRNWKLTMGWYWIKSLYGALSVPFILLKLPLISSLISHAKPTGYNRWGNAVPFLGKEEPPEAFLPWDPERNVERPDGVTPRPGEAHA